MYVKGSTYYLLKALLTGLQVFTSPYASVSPYCYMCVLICYMCVRKLLYVCPHTDICVSSFAIYVSAYCYICVLTLLYVSYCCICVLILLTIYVKGSSYLLKAVLTGLQILQQPLRALKGSTYSLQILRAAALLLRALKGS